MKANELMAEAMVEQGYDFNEIHYSTAFGGTVIHTPISKSLQPFSDTLEGYRQRDTLLNWLMDKHGSMYYRAVNLAYARYDTIQEQIVFVITDCFEQLAGER